MTRQSFIRNLLLSSIASLLPEMLRPMDGGVKEDGECVFDEKRINERLTELRKHPLTYDECFTYSFHYRDKNGQNVSTSSYEEWRRRPL